MQGYRTENTCTSITCHLLFVTVLHSQIRDFFFNEVHYFKTVLFGINNFLELLIYEKENTIIFNVCK